MHKDSGSQNWKRWIFQVEVSRLGQEPKECENKTQTGQNPSSKTCESSILERFKHIKPKESGGVILHRTLWMATETRCRPKPVTRGRWRNTKEWPASESTEWIRTRKHLPCRQVVHRRNLDLVGLSFHLPGHPSCFCLLSKNSGAPHDSLSLSCLRCIVRESETQKKSHTHTCAQNPCWNAQVENVFQTIENQFPQ